MTNVFQRFYRKIKKAAGETLAETLVSVLIISLSSVTLATLINFSSNMNLKAREYDKNLDEALTTVTTGTKTSGEAAETLETKVVVQLDSETKEECPVKLTYAEIGEKMLTSYELKIPEPSTPPAG